MEKYQVWECKVVVPADAVIPVGLCPLRYAVQDATKEMLGDWPLVVFSGWGGKLTDGQRRWMPKAPRLRMDPDAPA
jgi:hypothetical protein